MIDFLAATAEAKCAVPGLENVIRYGVIVVRIIQIVAPIALIIWGSIDLLKGIIAGDEKKISAARKPFLQRLISAVLIFLIPFIVDYVLTTFVEEGSNSWADCYQKASNASGDLKISSDPSTYSGKSSSGNKK